MGCLIWLTTNQRNPSPSDPLDTDPRLTVFQSYKTTFKRCQNSDGTFTYNSITPNNLPSSLPIIQKCGNNCLCCKALNTNPLITSSITKKNFCPITESAVLSCDSSGIVYLITCSKCEIQYVGQTTRALKVRFREHRNKIIKNDTSFLYKHFQLPGHSIDNLTIQILEVIPTSNQNIHATLLESELHWLKVLNTSCPYGLNDSIKGYGLISSGLNPCLSNKHPYFTIPLHRPYRSHGNRKRSTRKIDSTKVDRLIEQFNTEIIDYRSYYILLRSLKKKEIKYFKQQLSILNANQKLTLNFVIAAQAYIASYCSYDSPPEHNSYFLTCFFPNKGMELLKLNTIFKDRSLQKTIPINKKLLEKVCVVYQYEPPISQKLFNYSKTLKAISDNSLIQLPNCSCSNSQFLYGPSSHVITGNLNIIEDNKLRELFLKGSKYRLPKPIYWQDVEKSTFTAIDKYVNYLSRKHKVGLSNFKFFAKRAKNIIINRINYFISHKFTPNISSKISLNNNTELKSLHNKYVIVPADKAANNYVFICKTFYIQTLCSELGISVNNSSVILSGNNTYLPCQVNPSQLFTRHKLYTEGIGSSITDKNMCLPTIYAIPKLHKNPYKFRFIASATNCSTKPISLLLLSILKKFTLHFKN